MKNEAKLLKNDVVNRGYLFLLFPALSVMLVIIPARSHPSLNWAEGYLLEFQADATVKGQIVDVNGAPLPGVTIQLQGTTIGTVSDADGNYSLRVSPGSTLTFSFIGFKAQMVQVGNQSTINITMEEDLASLEEVVVTSLGVPRDQRALGYATTTVRSEDLIKVGTPNLATALYGKAPGVRIQASAGGATSAVNITIRGINSITGRNQPLIILDGVPIRNEEF